MKKLMIIILGLIPALVAAQSPQGKVTYNHKEQLKLNKEIESLQTKAIEGVTERNVTVELVFNKNESLYRAQPFEMPDMSQYESMSNEEQEKLGAIYKRAFGAQEHDLVYTNLSNENVAIRKTIRGREFLVNQVPKVEQWKLSPEEKVIAGYICKKAVKTDGDQEVVAWYALEISVSAGPLLYSNLPGVILEVNVGNGQLLITTEQVALGSKYNDLIEAPTKGKKVSLQEFEDIKRAKDQEMELLRQEDMRAEEAQRSGH